MPGQYVIIGADRQEYGPVSVDELKHWIVENRANRQTLVRAEDGTEWKPLEQWPDFQQALATAPLAPSTQSREPGTNIFAILGLVLGGISVVSSWCCCVFFFAVPGLICSIIGLAQTGGGKEKGNKLALAGLIISILGLCIYVLLTIYFTSVSEDFAIGAPF